MPSLLNSPLLTLTRSHHSALRRWTIFLVIGGLLLVMAFYTLTDPAHLAGSHTLQAADYVGYAVCHRITERSFTIAGRQFPLCARCTGMYLGVTLVFVVLGLAGRWRRARFPSLPVLLILLGFVGLMGIDGINSYSHFFPEAPHLYEPRNWLRLLTGMGTGLMMGTVVMPALAQSLWREPEWEPPVTSVQELAGIVVLAGLLILLLLRNIPLLSYVLAISSAGGVLLIMIALNTMLLLLLPRREGRLENWRQAAAPLLVGLLLATIEIALISFVRFQLTGTLTGFPGL